MTAPMNPDFQRVYDTQVQVDGDDFSVTIVEYHDEGPGWRNESRWHAHVRIIDDNGGQELNFNRGTQTALFAALTQAGGAFESAKTAVLEPAAD